MSIYKTFSRIVIIDFLSNVIGFARNYIPYVFGDSPHSKAVNKHDQRIMSFFRIGKLLTWILYIIRNRSI